MSATESRPTSKRDLKAATEYMVVTEHAPGMFEVYAEDGENAYVVDAVGGACECDDYRYRMPADGCKHVRRVRMRNGDRPLPPIPERKIDTRLLESQE